MDEALIPPDGAERSEQLANNGPMVVEGLARNPHDHADPAGGLGGLVRDRTRRSPTAS
jgi:hypothetical protein